MRVVASLGFAFDPFDLPHRVGASSVLLLDPLRPRSVFQRKAYGGPGSLLLLAARWSA